jgi:hypothetical protein
MSDDIKELLTRGEAAARLHGLIAMLALPTVRAATGADVRRVIEIQLADGRWERVHRAEVSSGMLALYQGDNGESYCFTFDVESPPIWRCDHNAADVRSRVAGAPRPDAGLGATDDGADDVG